VREQELRIALVCFGGVSLAVYMHGISKEILKLVRASSALHAIADRQARATAQFFDRFDPHDPEFDTEAVYFELLREIGRKLELRVIVDIIAGASAGGINGTMLARAISHDLPIGKLRDLWLDNADISVILASEARAGARSKWILKPFIWGAARSGWLALAADREVRNKLSLFLRSRWFKPPLDGARMSELMYDAVTAMEAPREPGASLLPATQRLELFVTLTDFHGYRQPIAIHDPPLIHEQEHRHVLRFSYRRGPDGEVESDFALANAPALAFAARATSSFPGAFPPAGIAEIDALVSGRGAAWPTRAAFIAANFARHVEAGVDPVSCSFIDGSVLNNRPFREAIAAIQGRPAYRPVDRRIVYIEPDPTSANLRSAREIPGFFATLRAAMSDIPRNQPVADELRWIRELNQRAHRLKILIEGARPFISGLVGSVVTADMSAPITPDQIRSWREHINARVARDAGFAYQSYVRLKLIGAHDFVARTLVRLCGSTPQSLAAQAIAHIIDAWAERTDNSYAEPDGVMLYAEAAAQPLASWARLLLAFDVEYRKRRLHFLIEGLNRVYEMIDRPGFESLHPTAINDLKRALYGRLEALHARESPARFSAATRQQVTLLFAQPLALDHAGDLAGYARGFVDSHADAIDRLVDQLAAEIDLASTTRDLDITLASMNDARWSAAPRRDVLINYLGFPFWDVLTLSATTAQQAGEFNEILINRISPQDSTTLTGFNGYECLKGVRLGHFAAFFSRAYRENDYLLGRLHAIDRLIDIVCDSGRVDSRRDGIAVLALKKRAFLQVLDVEAKHLGQSTELIAALRACIAGLDLDDAVR
jgi:patatin-related protein